MKNQSNEHQKTANNETSLFLARAMMAEHASPHAWRNGKIREVFLNPIRYTHNNTSGINKAGLVAIVVPTCGEFNEDAGFVPHGPGIMTRRQHHNVMWPKLLL